MAIHNEVGKQGEDLGEKFLAAKGFIILHRNWRHGHCEIDIIALKNEIPHFVEVKTRSGGGYRLPEESVNRTKLRSLLSAANGFLMRNRHYKDFRIDILSIIYHINAEPEYFFIEDVYF